MDGPTIEEARGVKAEIVRRFEGHAAFAGAGIGERNGRLVVKVNWRTLPAATDRPDHIGTVEITHDVVGAIKSHQK